MFYFYIIQNEHSALYIGVTKNLKRRIKRHNFNRGSKYTSDLPGTFCLVYSEEYENLGDAISREKQVKKWSRAKKIALIQGDKEKLIDLSKSRI